MKRQRLEAARELRMLAELRLRHERTRADQASHAARQAENQLGKAQGEVETQHVGALNALADPLGVGAVMLPLWAEGLRAATRHRDAAQHAHQLAHDEAQLRRSAVQGAQAVHEQIGLRCRRALRSHLDERDARTATEILGTRWGGRED